MQYNLGENMSKSNDDYSLEWENDEVRVDVPFSVAGVGTTIVLESKFTGKKMLLDVGDGATQALFRSYSKSSAEDLTLIAISHGHFDHIGGLYSVLGFLRMLNRKTPLDILFPKDSSEVMEIIGAFRDSYTTTIPFDIRCHELRHGVGFDTDFFKIIGYTVEHFDSYVQITEIRFDPALGFRVSIGDTVIAYSGDTGMCSNLEDIVKDADLALIEATYHKPPQQEIRAHLSLEEAESLAKLAKNHLIIHQVPAWVRNL